MIGSIITEVRDNIDFSNLSGAEISMPVVLLADDLVFPFTPQTVEINDAATLEMLHKRAEDHKTIFVGYNTGSDKKNNEKRVGTVCKVLKVLELPDNTPTVFLLPGPVAHLVKITRANPYLRGYVSVDREIINPDDPHNLAAIDAVADIYNRTIDEFCEDPKELKEGLNAISAFEQKLYFITAHSPLKAAEKYRVLAAESFAERCAEATKLLSEAFQLMKIKSEIQRATHEELSRQQKEHFLRQQMQTIQNELGGSAEDVEEDELKTRAAQMDWPEYAATHFDKEVKKLERFNMQNPEYSVQYNYLDTLLSLPWNRLSDDNFNLDRVEEILDRDHYGLEKVKERILEQVAVLKLRADMKAPVLCLYGPPGVGKTSLGRSVAEALGREYCRVSLGGLHDEAEIRGHRRTYIGAMPGRIMSAMKNCGTSNPVFVLDEIDKIGHDFKGDPSTALLEVLDPEQNVKFHDNYVDIDYDLSKVLFIATANDLSTISRPLLDRMELVNISGYVTDEKEHIALRHLIPHQLEEHGFDEGEISFTQAGVRYLIERHTRESGVRQLDKNIARVLRKIARLKASGKEFVTEITPTTVENLLGAPEIMPEVYEDNDTPGVVTGLAWTQSGGEILFVESALSKGKGDVLTLTGNLGDVMKESAVIALKYLKSNAESLGIDPAAMDGKDVHIHVPEGAIPKDGPSAGITMLVSLASSFTGRKVREKLAMTGEITLRGKLTPVGGVKEKILAAKRAGITDIILSDKNRKDIDEINSEYLQGLSFYYFDRIAEALDFALLPPDLSVKSTIA